MEIKPVLSILIATMPHRYWDFNILLVALSSQFKDAERPNKLPEPEPSIFAMGNVYNPEIEIVYDDSMDYNIGTKRNKLLQRAKGDYIVYVDDDDTISTDYVSKIFAAIKTNPDCIGISGTITFNGLNSKQWHISKKYGHWYEKNNIYYRTPNHISPVKRELALKAGFPEISFGEDAVYSERLLPLLKTEVVIPGNLYIYRYDSKK